MSFSGNVKEELVRQTAKSRHCQLAELAAVMEFLGKISIEEGSERIILTTENTGVARKFITLIKLLFSYEVQLEVIANQATKNRSYRVTIEGKDRVDMILKAVKKIDEHGALIHRENLVAGLLVQQTCCKRAFIRGAFLAAGSMSNPEKSYHLEIVAPTRPKAEQLMEMMNGFELDAKIVPRKNHFVVYLKEGAQIVDLLNVMEAHKSLMDLENVRIVKNMRNNVNRQVNCETANINKTVNAAVRQLEDIRYVDEQIGLSALPVNLQEIAQIRLEHPQSSLVELGQMLNPPVGKSGVNHRLRKISETAQKLRGDD
ncbi:MAG: DNA-binding protein WhiA [Eubacterium sp.]|nr:DNA-binding protein WhiA [Eubacterium sp.]